MKLMSLRILKTTLLLFVLASLGLAFWLTYNLHAPRQLPSGAVLYEVPRGAGLKTVARSLKEEGLLQNRLAFLAAYHFFYARRTIKAGEYLFASPLRTKDILTTLVEGKVYLHPVTIPEGLTGIEIAPLLVPLLADGEEGFRRAFQNPAPIAALDPQATDLEGYLFPETYHFARGVESGRALRSMVAEFTSIFEQVWRERARALGLTVRQVVTLASLIEKETAIPEEKPMVAAVFHNRLRRGMKLDCDPTIIYVLKQKGLFDGNLRKKDMSLDSPYNTYLHAGLPPGPICNPGKEALEAALYPAQEDYLYFVSRNDGRHHFSRSFSEHQAAVRRYQKRRP